MSLAALTAQFPPPVREAWTALAEKALRGASLDSLVRERGGLTTRPLYVAGDAEAVAVARRPFDVARRPFDQERPWDIRAVLAHPDPAVCHAHALEDLEGGAASLLLKVGGDGREGLAFSSPAALQAALGGVMIELASVALDAGFAGVPAARALSEFARRSPRALLAFHLDPLGAFAEGGVSPGPITAHLAGAAEVGADLAETYPLATLFLANGRAAHEAGGSDVQELAAMAAATVAYAQALIDAGLSPADAFGRIVLGVSVDGAFLKGLAKLRAARLIWAQLVAAAGLDLPARIEARASRRMLARADAWTNLLRLSAAAFAGAVGGADAMVLEPFTQPLGAPDALARRQARNIQLILMEEAALGRVQDPARGAWFADAATAALARDAWSAFQAIEAGGGLAAALTSGAVARDVAAARAAELARFAGGSAKLVGVNLHPDGDGAPPPVAPSCALVPPSADLHSDGPDDLCPPLTPISWEALLKEAPA